MAQTAKEVFLLAEDRMEALDSCHPSCPSSYLEDETCLGAEGETVAFAAIEHAADLS